VRVKEERNILHTIKRKAYWIGHFFRRNCFLKHVIEGKIGKKGSDGNTRKNSKQLLDDLKKERGYWKLNEEKTRSHCTENSLWKRLWICRMTAYKIN
jgi:hypothetical protein